MKDIYSTDKVIYNAYGMAARIALVIAIVGMVVFFGEIGLSNKPAPDLLITGFALFFISGIVSITLSMQQHKIDKIVKPKHQFVFWEYDDRQWNVFMNQYFQDTNRGTVVFGIMIVIIVAQGLFIYFSVDADVSGALLLIYLLIALFISLAGYVMPRHRDRFIRENPPVVVISEKGLYLNGKILEFNYYTLEGKISETKDEQNYEYIIISYERRQRNFFQPLKFYIPIPPEHIDEKDMVKKELTELMKRYTIFGKKEGPE